MISGGGSSGIVRGSEGSAMVAIDQGCGLLGKEAVDGMERQSLAFKGIVEPFEDDGSAQPKRFCRQRGVGRGAVLCQQISLFLSEGES